MVRGKTYTFVIEGGNDPDQPAAYHPFYITDDPEGGYEFMTPEQRRKVQYLYKSSLSNVVRPIYTYWSCSTT